MIKPITYTILCFAAVVSLAMTLLPAEAKAELIAFTEAGNWSVFAEPNDRMCIAAADYDTGRGIAIGLYQGAIQLMVTGAPTTPGTTYVGFIDAAVGTDAILIFEALDDGSLIASRLTAETTKALTDADTFKVNLGDSEEIFSLAGSKAAVGAALECYQIFTSF